MIFCSSVIRQCSNAIICYLMFKHFACTYTMQKMFGLKSIKLRIRKMFDFDKHTERWHHITKHSSHIFLSKPIQYAINFSIYACTCTCPKVIWNVWRMVSGCKTALPMEIRLSVCVCVCVFLSWNLLRYVLYLLQYFCQINIRCCRLM